MEDDKPVIGVKYLELDFTGIDSRSLGWQKLYKSLQERIFELLGRKTESALIVTTLLKQIIKDGDSPNEIRQGLEFLSRVNWEELLEERDFRRDKEICVLCDQVTSSKTARFLYSGFWSGIGVHCSNCLQELEKTYNRKCYFCAKNYLPDRKGTLANICDDCYAKRPSREQVMADRIGAYLLETDGDLTLLGWLKTIKHFNNKCAYCLANSCDDIEHFIPRSAGGKTTLANCVPACRSCNSRKNDRDPRENAMTEFAGIMKIREFFAQTTSNSI